MKKLILASVLVLVGAAIGYFVHDFLKSETKITFQKPQEIPRPLDKYTIENLAKANIKPTKIGLEKQIKETKDFTSSIFSFEFDPTLVGGNNKKVSGLINIPKEGSKFPVIVMVRGYIDPNMYIPGMGTKNAAEYFASHGFITVAPDFLGYGESDKETEDIFEARFQTYTTLMTTLASVNSIPGWDGKNIFIWGHSNGGQISLTTLEITGKDYPTVLWAPVSKPFPYSILYYTDEVDDNGKFLRLELAKFEQKYDSDLYSPHKYLDRIQAKIDLEQGTADEEVPVVWTTDLTKKLKDLGKDVTYNQISGADHNMQPLKSWNKAIEDSLVFFQKNIK